MLWAVEKYSAESASYYLHGKVGELLGLQCFLGLVVKYYIQGWGRRWW